MMTLIKEPLQMLKSKDMYSLFIDEYLELSKGECAKMFDSWSTWYINVFFFSGYVKTELTVTNNRALF